MKKLILALTAVFILGIGGQWIYGNRSTPNRNEKTVEALRVVEKPVQAFDVKPYPVTEVPKPVEAKQVIVTSPSKEVAKEVTKEVAKPVATPEVKPALKPVIKSVQKPVVKVATKPATVAPIVLQPKPQLLIEKIKSKGNSEQAIVVTSSGFGVIQSTITTFEKVNGTWKQIISVPGNVGIRGFAYNKVEGDDHTPIGIFSLGTAFGVNSNPETALGYKACTSNSFWVDDSKSALYNTWQEGPANGRWTSAENMNIVRYTYGFVINYNTAARTPLKGSAIFFHVWSGAGSGTAGCIATSQSNVISILRWLKPSKNPLIIEGPMSEVLKM